MNAAQAKSRMTTMIAVVAMSTFLPGDADAGELREEREVLLLGPADAGGFLSSASAGASPDLFSISFFRSSASSAAKSTYSGAVPSGRRSTCSLIF